MTTKWLFLGLDPGGSGGLACVTEEGPSAGVRIVATPDGEADIRAWIQAIIDERTNVYATIEKLWGYAGNDKAGGNGPAMFKLGQSYGFLRGILIGLQVPFEEVTPQAWQKAFGIPKRDSKRGETQPQFKNRIKAKAQQLFPGVHITLATADALLMAEFCRRQYGGIDAANRSHEEGPAATGRKRKLGYIDPTTIYPDEPGHSQVDQDRLWQ